MSVVIKEIETKGVMTNAFLYKKTVFYKFCDGCAFIEC